MKKRIFIQLFFFFTSFLLVFHPCKTLSVTIILTSDQQLSELLDPDNKIDLSTGHKKQMASLREICESASKRGDTILTIAFDEFFRQYREHAGTERLLTPDMDEYIEKIKVIGDFASQYAMGIGLSLNSPLELGPAYKNSTGESGRWLHFKVGYKDPATGKFNISMWQQVVWTNNKGSFTIKLKDVKAYAFREKTIGRSPFRAVSPVDIIEIQGVKYEALDDIPDDPENKMAENSILKEKKIVNYTKRNIRIYNDGNMQLKGYDRVLVILEYETPEMDYFSPNALPFLKNLMKKYHDRGVNLVSLYSDEMHIQQNWHYFGNQENGQFSLRYLTPHFSEAFRNRFGQELDDKYMLYFVYGAPVYMPIARAVRNIQYVMGPDPEDIHRTFLLRDRYYKMLNHGVTDLFINSKKYAESLFGRTLETYAHASWAESPTIDLWDTEKLPEYASNYEYTSNYVWGNTVQQAAAACYDYFKWGEYLEPTGNDFAECGWLDRNYYGAAMAASIGVINKYPCAYAAAWGMPYESMMWRLAINNAFGAGSFNSPAPVNHIIGNVHRDIEVLILYPMNLVAVEERFGSWMTQYAYANYLTSEKLMEMGSITDNGLIRVADKYYNTLVTVFEPLPHEGLLKFMNEFAEKGGNVIWCGPPPLLDNKGENCMTAWKEIFGVNYVHDQYMGEIAAGKIVDFTGSFSSVPSQAVLTDFLVDRFYPVQPGPDVEIVAKSDKLTLGTHMIKGKGSTYFFGFRPRDDQSQSLGYETKTMFGILNAAGAYKGSEKFRGINDNPTYISRNSEYFVTSFPNKTTVIVKHYRTHPENWQGGFSRNREDDLKVLAGNPLPSDTLVLKDFKVNGQLISYAGKLLLAFRQNASGQLIAFKGQNCKEFTINNKSCVFSSKPLETIVFYPENDDLLTYTVIIKGEEKVNLPVPLDKQKKLTIYTEENKEIHYTLNKGGVSIEIGPEISGKKLRLIQL